MSKSINIYNKMQELYRDHKLFEEKIFKINTEMNVIRDKCPHEMVIIFSDHLPKMIDNLCHCYCPFCGKTLSIYTGHGINKTIFATSKILDLTETVIESKEELDIIQDEIISNYPYYKNNNDIKELETGLINILKEKNKVLKK